LIAYNDAVGHAQAQRWNEALETLGLVLRCLPSFVPAIRLQGLVLAATGKPDSAREAWERGLAWCRDDPVFQRYVTAIGGRPARRSPAAIGTVSHTPVGRYLAAFGTGALSVALVIAVVAPLTLRRTQRTAPSTTTS